MLFSPNRFKNYSLCSASFFYSGICQENNRNSGSIDDVSINKLNLISYFPLSRCIWCHLFLRKTFIGLASPYLKSFVTDFPIYLFRIVSGATFPTNSTRPTVCSGIIILVFIGIDPAGSHSSILYTSTTSPLKTDKQSMHY